MYEACATMQSFFTKILKSEDCSTELQFLETNYADNALKAQLGVFKVSMNGCDNFFITCFDDSLDKMKEIDR